MSRKWLLAVIILVIGLGAYLVPKLHFETDLSGLRLADDAAVQEYNMLSANYPSQEENPILILNHSTGWNNYADYLLMDSITNLIAEFEEIAWVSSITNLEIPKKGAFKVSYEPHIPLNTKTEYDDWAKSKHGYSDVFKKYVSANQLHALFYLDCENGLSKESLQKIDSINSALSNCEILVLQNNLAQDQIRSELARESLILGAICIGLILLSFFLLTKALKGLVLITSIILFNIACTVIFMYAMNISFNVQMIALPCLIIILSFTDLMHILHQQTALANNTASAKGLKLILKKNLAKPIFLTSLSNIFGFIIFLILSKNTDLTDLALVAIVAVLIAYLSSRFIAIHLMGPREKYIDPVRINRIQSYCQRLANRFKPSKRIRLLQISIVLAILLYFLFNNFKIDTSKAGFLSNDSELRKSQEIIAEHFYGSNTLEISISFNERDSLWTTKNLRKIEVVENLITTLFNPLYTISPTTIVKRNHRFTVNGHPDAYKIPNNISVQTRADLNERYDQWGGNQVVAEHVNLGNIIVGYQHPGLHESLHNYTSLDSLFQLISDESIGFNLTGPAYLSDLGTYTFTRNLIIGWSIGVLLSVLLIGFILRSFIKGLILLLVNLIPLILVVLLMPLFGLEINPQSLFLLTILAGLCVDDSIYIMLQGKKQEIGFYPVLVTSTVLAAGFVSFGFSNLAWLSPFAWIFLIGIATALLLDLFILPLFIQSNKE
ncbi:MAG: putative RND superfamily exporter protein [Crocinitomix sp.]|jgi:predicted RND superfamily exporter protein